MTLSENNYYDAITVMSPMYDGDEKKDQDRAVWSFAALTGCVCDGVTSSPYSREAAEMITKLASAILSGDIRTQLGMASNLLKIWREERLIAGIELPANTPEQMRTMLHQAALENLKRSYQTTMVAARLIPGKNAVTVITVRCGDSIFLAYGPDGRLLTASHPDVESLTHHDSKLGPNIIERGTEITFGPGDELMAKVLCHCNDHIESRIPPIIKSTRMPNWLVCSVLDKCNEGGDDTSVSNHSTIKLRLGDLLLVPRHLAAVADDYKRGTYIRFIYSRLIRSLKTGTTLPLPVDFQKAGSTTAVLPDHFYTGHWTHFEDRFPLDTSYVLASDGFFSCFNDPNSLWLWLQKHNQKLLTEQGQAQLMAGLHRFLRKNSSDDDISFVWIYPKCWVDGFDQANKETEIGANN